MCTLDNLVTKSIEPPPSEANTSSTKGTIMKRATQMETDEVINQLLDIDVHQEDNETGEYDIPIAPNQIPVQPVGTVPKTNTDAQTITKDAGNNNIKPLLLPRVLGTAIKIETSANNENSKPKTKVFKTVEYKLKRRYSKPRKFSCVKCVEKFETQKELNDHFCTTHPPVKCDLCQEHFDTPAAMLQHKYKHYEYMYECKICDKGFQFESQKCEHMRVHQTQGDWVCFKPKCGKRFKESLSSMRISFLITRSLKNANTVRIPTLILITYEHTCENIATCYPLSAANVAKDSSGSSSMLDILTQANVQDPTIKHSYCLVIVRYVKKITHL